MTRFSELNFLRSRKEFMERNRKAKNPVGIEKAMGKECRWIRRSDGYFCGLMDHNFQSKEDHIAYGGKLHFNYRHDLEEIKVNAEQLTEKEAFDILRCAEDKLNILPEFRECKSVFLEGEPSIRHRKHSKVFREAFNLSDEWYDTVKMNSRLSYENKCGSADDIRRSATPHHNKIKHKWKLQKLKLQKKETQKKLNEISEGERKRKMKLEIGKMQRNIREIKERLKDDEYFEERWNKIYGSSIANGFFFNSMGLTSDYDGDIRSFNTGGVILSPIHETLDEEIEILKKASKEALYVCTPPEKRIGNRTHLLKYFEESP